MGTYINNQTRFTGKADLKILFCTLVMMIFTFSGFAQNAEKKPIYYISVEEALTALKSNPAADLTEYEGWKIYKLKQDGQYILWSFTPVEHPAHPTVVKRSIRKLDSQITIDMDALCESSELICESLVEEFKYINEQIIQRESSSQ